MNDLISRQQALKEMWKALYEYEDKTEKQFQKSKDLDVRDWIMNDRLWVQNGHNLCVNVLANLPSAQPEKTCCGYDEKELIAFAIACRRNEVDEKDLKTFAQDCEFAWRVMQEEFESKIREAFEKWTGGKSDAD